MFVATGVARMACCALLCMDGGPTTQLTMGLHFEKVYEMVLASVMEQVRAAWQ